MQKPATSRFARSARWISLRDSRVAEARATARVGHAVVNATQLAETAGRNVQRIIGRPEVQRLSDALLRWDSELNEELVPNLL